MTGTVIARPASTEYVPYFAKYIDLVPEGDVLDLMRRQVEETAALVGKLSERDADHRYGEGKWSIKEVIGHLADAERIFLYRAVCFARGEPKELPGWDENAYVAQASFGARRIADLVAELKAARAASVAFFAGLTAEELARSGTANQRRYSVRAVAYVALGHERHHCNIIRERYLPGRKRT